MDSSDHSTQKSDGHGPELSPGGQVRGSDGQLRPPWAASSELLQEYYDQEWGRFVITEHGLLERLVLEGFQSGLSWSTILRKRRAFRSAFFLFDATRIVAMTDEQKQAALADEGMIRNRLKREALHANARATVALREDPELQALPADSPARTILGGLADRLPAGLPVLLWSFAPAEHQQPGHVEDIPSSSPESVEMAKELRRRGFRFVGPTTCYALMQAVGMVNDRVPN
ncbi:DNA-3-methyladenine glycosylase I [Corynebacterium heidelbergense]|uniref:DNA-3-methyladenine glycosylase I n=1 Tax=Corynebacterium heidelbergense TaxID=2055947 RepID=A0A364V5H0_9CORY|nr:DNA-3-methyladenine glycosylase I [Corynebacterium heidelbergense]RAV31885.1 DNA-3-methyladenine glycosylase I [Corynebacterium heidelbergense]